MDRISIYWDTQDPANPGWAWRLYADQVELESGPLEAPADATPGALVAAFAAQVGYAGQITVEA